MEPNTIFCRLRNHHKFSLIHEYRSSYNNYPEVADVTENSPYWIYNESCDEEYHTKNNEEEVTQALVLSIVGQFGCLQEKKTEVIIHNEFYAKLFFFQPLKKFI